MPDFEFEKRLARLQGLPEPHYGAWKSRQLAAAQTEQRRMWGEVDEKGNRT